MLVGGARFARWFIFIPKIPIWVYFGAPGNGKIYDHLVCLMAIWYV
jgi:hypothetical protein